VHGSCFLKFFVSNFFPSVWTPYRSSVTSDSATPWTIQSMEFSRPEYWSGQPFPSPGDLPNPGIEPRSPTLQADSLPVEPQGKPLDSLSVRKILHQKGEESVGIYYYNNTLCLSNAFNPRSQSILTHLQSTPTEMGSWTIFPHFMGEKTKTTQS